MTQPDDISHTGQGQGRDGGLRPGDEHLDPDSPDVELALAALEADDDD
jgi:hypothetical protein